MSYKPWGLEPPWLEGGYKLKLERLQGDYDRVKRSLVRRGVHPRCLVKQPHAITQFGRSIWIT